MRTIEELIAPVKTALTSVCPNVGRYRANDTTTTYVYYMEDGEGEDVPADNIKENMVLTGEIHMYARPSDIGLADMIQASLSQNGVSWTFASNEYEEATNFVHYSWDFEVV